jgi:hypothetical protein
MGTFRHLLDIVPSHAWQQRLVFLADVTDVVRGCGDHQLKALRVTWLVLELLEAALKRGEFVPGIRHPVCTFVGPLDAFSGSRYGCLKFLRHLGMERGEGLIQVINQRVDLPGHGVQRPKAAAETADDRPPELDGPLDPDCSRGHEGEHGSRLGKLRIVVRAKRATAAMTAASRAVATPIIQPLCFLVTVFPSF